jgi:hypothetical protein
MARGIQRADFPYEVENPDLIGEVAFTCLISMDKFNIDEDADQKIKPATGTPIPFHVYTKMNEELYGIHPRKFRLKYEPAANEEGDCQINNPVRYVEIPVLTIAQFNSAKVFDEKSTDAQDDAKIEINHSANGGSGLTYVIIEKVKERLV